MAKVEIECGKPDEAGICRARDTRLWLDGQKINGVNRLTLDFPISGAVNVDVGLFASDGFRLEADGVLVKAEVTPLPGYELLVYERDGVTSYTTRRIPVDVTAAEDAAKRFVP